MLLENVPFMLRLAGGQAMRHVTSALEELGFAWAYRVVDARSFGLPQRRLRVVLLASRTEDPRQVLFGEDAGAPADSPHEEVACGFYWTEGTRGLGWAVDAVTTLKGGSSISIASPPAVRRLDGSIVTPGITDAERLQGFDPGWTLPASLLPGVRDSYRWKLIGNAVSTRLSSWLGERLATPVAYDGSRDRRLQPGAGWPVAAWGYAGQTYEVPLSSWPVRAPYESLEGFLADIKPLSAGHSWLLASRPQGDAALRPRLPRRCRGAPEPDDRRPPSGMTQAELLTVPPLLAALAAADPKPAPTAERGEKKNYAQRLSNSLAQVLADALRPRYPEITPTAADGGQERGRGVRAVRNL